MALKNINVKVCSVCGISYDQIIKTQIIGCPECYYTFAEEFSASLENYGVKGDYKGTFPKHLKGYKSNLVNRVEMQLKLEEAIQKEEYEKAAFYRDYLKALNTDKVTSGEENENEE